MLTTALTTTLGRLFKASVEGRPRFLVITLPSARSEQRGIRLQVTDEPAGHFGIARVGETIRPVALVSDSFYKHGRGLAGTMMSVVRGATGNDVVGADMMVRRLVNGIVSLRF
eukprot:jgi/Mesvir1/1515/Mv14498-RA.1